MTIFVILLYKRMDELVRLDTAYQSAEYSNAVATQKLNKPAAPATKVKRRGRSVVKTDDLVDLADLSFEEGYKVIEELGNG